MNVVHLVSDLSRNCVRDLHEMTGCHGIEEMLSSEVAVAEMPSSDLARHRSADAGESIRNLLLRRVHQLELVLWLSIPNDHVVADVPLDAEILVRDVPAYCFDLPIIAAS